MTSSRMMLLLAAVAVSAVAVHGAKDSVLEIDAFTNNMEPHFQQFEEARHPRDASRSTWMNSRTYIQDNMQKIGLDVQLQCFNTSVQVENDDHRYEEGCNIIGIFKGDTNKDRIVVGAHYDTSGETTQQKALRDNGVGVAVLLETAKAYVESVKWKGFHSNLSVIFVAFDLNTKEQFPESQGLPGSHYFISEWLEPMTNRDRLPIAGAYIIDSISTYNREDDTQVLPADFKNVFPEAYETITTMDRKGDFLAAIAPQDSKKLVDSFAGHYRMDRRARPYRLQEMVAGSNMFGSGGTLDMVNHQASYRFWESKPSIPAVLISDTDDGRVWPVNEQCDIDCNYVFANEERMQFVFHTYKALTHTLLDMQTTYVGLAASSSATSSCLTLLVSALIAQIFLQV